jgi:hypothetical protein
MMATWVVMTLRCAMAGPRFVAGALTVCRAWSVRLAISVPRERRVA